MKINDDGTTGTSIITSIKSIISFVNISTTNLTYNLIYLSVFFTSMVIMLQCVATVHFKSEFYFDLQKMNKNILTIWNIYSYSASHINRWDTRICLIFDEYYKRYIDQLCIKRYKDLMLEKYHYYSQQIYSIHQSHVLFHW